MLADQSKAKTILKELLSKTSQPKIEDLKDSDTCMICQEPYLTAESPELPLKLSCGHIAGAQCLLKWMSPLSPDGKNSCPICRHKILDIPLELPRDGGVRPRIRRPSPTRPTANDDWLQYLPVVIGNVRASYVTRSGDFSESDVQRMTREPHTRAELERMLDQYQSNNHSGRPHGYARGPARRQPPLVDHPARGEETLRTQPETHVTPRHPANIPRANYPTLNGNNEWRIPRLSRNPSMWSNHNSSFVNSNQNPTGRPSMLAPMGGIRRNAVAQMTFQEHRQEYRQDASLRECAER